MSHESGEDLEGSYQYKEGAVLIEVPDRYLLDTDPAEIAAHVAPDEVKAKILAAFIAREQEKWRDAVKADGEEKAGGFRRLIIRNIRNILEHPDMYYGYKEKK